MSVAVSTIEANVRQLIHDTVDPQTVDDDELRVHLNMALQRVAERAGLAATWESSYITLAADDFDTVLDDSIEYQRIITMRLVSTQQPLRRVTPEKMLEIRAGSDSWPGDPYLFAIHEEDDQTVVLWTHYVTSGGDALDVLLSATPQAVDEDTDEIPISAELASALQCYTAATLFSAMGQVERQALSLPATFGQDMRAEAEAGIKHDRRRRERFRRTDRLPYRRVPV